MWVEFGWRIRFFSSLTQKLASIVHVNCELWRRPRKKHIPKSQTRWTCCEFWCSVNLNFSLRSHAGIGRVALDTRLGCLEPNLATNSEPQQIINAAKYALRNVATLELKFPFWRYFPTPLWTKYVNNMNYFVEICMKYIQEATNKMKSRSAAERAAMGEPSLLEKVIQSEKNEKIATIMALDLILVGIDTVSSTFNVPTHWLGYRLKAKQMFHPQISMAVCSILYQLAIRQEEQAKIYEELCRVIPDPNTPLTYQLLDQCHYLKAFIKEVFRVYSTVIGNGRTLQEDTVICGYNIPKGIQVVFPTIVTGSMEEYCQNSEVFRPERWLKPNQGGTGEYMHPFASLPYGYGARMCLGRRFADLEMQILLAKVCWVPHNLVHNGAQLLISFFVRQLLRSHKLEYNYEPLDYAVTFMYAPDGKLKFKMTRRD